jgi:hypothetical protein
VVILLCICTQLFIPCLKFLSTSVALAHVLIPFPIWCPFPLYTHPSSPSILSSPWCLSIVCISTCISTLFTPCHVKGENPNAGQPTIALYPDTFNQSLPWPPLCLPTCSPVLLSHPILTKIGLMVLNFPLEIWSQCLQFLTP